MNQRLIEIVLQCSQKMYNPNTVLRYRSNDHIVVSYCCYSWRVAVTETLSVETPCGVDLLAGQVYHAHQLISASYFGSLVVGSQTMPQALQVADVSPGMVQVGNNQDHADVNQTGKFMLQHFHWAGLRMCHCMSNSAMPVKGGNGHATASTITAANNSKSI